MLLIRKLNHKIKQILNYYLNSKYWISNFDRKNIKEFSIFINKTFKKKDKRNVNNKILIEGHFANSGINYLFRLILIAKTIQSSKGGNITVFFNGQKQIFWRITVLIYKKIGVNSFIYNDWEFKEHKSHIVNELSLKLWNKVKKTSDILDLNIDDLLVGDLLYDEILKKEDLFTIEKVELRYKKYFDNISKLYFDYDNLFKNGNFSYYVGTHTAYIEYGLIYRIAVKYGVKVFESNDVITGYCDNNLFAPTVHQGIKNLILKKKMLLDKDEDLKKKLMKKYDDNLVKRMQSKFNQLDVINAYKNKEFYDREKLEFKYPINSQNKNVFIVAHVFKDSPHTSSYLIFNDYYDWLAETLKFFNENSHKYNCFVKSHPSSEFYGEKGIIENYLIRNNFKNIHILNEKFSPESFIECADVIITCQGTVGVEFSCYGIPIITAGNAFYSDFGYTIDPKNKLEYFSVLENIENLNNLTFEQIKMANYIYSIYSDLIISENPLITSEVLDLVWGINNEKNLEEAFKLFMINLRKYGVKSHPLHNKILEILSMS